MYTSSIPNIGEDNFHKFHIDGAGVIYVTTTSWVVDISINEYKYKKIANFNQQLLMS